MDNNATNTVQDTKANWDFLTTNEVVVKEAPIQEVVATQPEVKETTLTIDKPEEVKPDHEKPVDTPAETKPADAEKPADPPAQPEVLDLKLDVADIKDAPVIHPENSALALAQELGIKIEKDDFNDLKLALKESYVPKSDLDKARAETTEVLYSKLDPKLATAFKMIDVGVPAELAFNPTGQHDYLLSLDDAALIRSKFEAMEGVEPEAVDAKMEELASEGKLSHLAAFERAALNKEKQNILNQQTSIYNQLVEQKQLEQVKVKQESDTKFMTELSKASTFIGLPLSKEAKAVIEAKFKKGSYDNVLNEAQNKLTAILHHEFGHKFISTAISKAEAKGEANLVRKLSDVPPKKEFAGGRATEQTEPNQNSNWDFQM